MGAARCRRKARLKSEPVSRNEGEPHRMSSESAKIGEPSHYANGEGCQDRAGQSRKDVGPQSLGSDQRTGGVSGGGGPGQEPETSIVVLIRLDRTTAGEPDVTPEGAPQIPLPRFPAGSKLTAPKLDQARGRVRRV